MMHFICPKLRLVTKIDFVKSVEKSTAFFCPPPYEPALEGQNTQTFGIVKLSKTFTYVTLNDTYYYSDIEQNNNRPSK